MKTYELEKIKMLFISSCIYNIYVLTLFFPSKAKWFHRLCTYFKCELPTKVSCEQRHWRTII